VRLPNATMVVSQTLQEYYRAHYGAETLYVPNGTTLRDWRQPNQILQWGLEPGQYILFLGRFSPEKNCHLLLEAYENLDTPVKLVLAGGSSHTDGYAQQMRLHQSSRIILLEWVRGDVLEELLTNAMLFVLPSDLEGLSLALLEAMSAGVCVLTSDTPENREVVESVGFTFHSGDRTDLERMMRLLLSDPQLRKLAGESARSRVRERYLWTQVANQIAQAYQELAGQDHARKASVRHKPPGKTQARTRDAA